MNPPSKEFRDKAAAEISEILKEVPTVGYRDENGTLVLPSESTDAQPANDVQERTRLEELAAQMESTVGSGTVSKENQKILHMYSTGEIDYNEAIQRIKKSPE